jgi:glycopeptide antibiotics resistance protein
MNRIRTRVSSAAAYFETQSLARGLGRVLLVCSVLGVFFAATFPFDFSLPAQTPWDWRWNPYDPNYSDRTENILFFMPLGFALASMISPTRRFRWALQIIVALVVGFLLTACVESLQQYVSFRDPSLADLWCNTLGGVLGAIVYLLVGDHLLRGAARLLLHLKVLARSAVLAAALVLYASGQIALPFILRSAGDMSGWDHNVWLWLGANATSNTPWNGNLWNVALADHAATPEQVLQLAQGAVPASVLGESLVGDYRTLGPAPYADRSAHLSPLAFMQNDVEPSPTTAPASVTADQTLRTSLMVAPAIFRIARTSQFTLAMTLATWNQEERGPAIICTIAGNEPPFDVVIGQEYTDLTLRLRSGVHGAPQFHLRNVFADNSKQHITITQSNAQTIFYVNGHEQGRVEVTPEAKVIWRLYPRGHFRMWTNTYGFRSYAVMYRLLVFIPFAALLGAMLATVKWKSSGKRLVGIAATVLMAVALEIVLSLQTASGFQVKNLLISLAVGLLALGGLGWWRKRSVMKRKVRFG